jgi:UDP-4-amino-4,6-dideoxy-N-acetyl-beta-L-altrosamine transaminase
MKSIPYGRQWIEEKDIRAVVNVLKSDYLTQGPVIEQFESAVAKYCGAKYAVAVSSGTAALHIACLAAELGQGDILWTSSNTFVASANCALYCGAKPDFVDIDPHTYNISVDAMKAKLSKVERNGSFPKIVIPIHFAGLTCDIAEIKRIADKYKLVVIEDACHAFGAEYRVNDEWVKVGRCLHSDMTVFSFHPVKHITTGEGGAITTNNQDLYEKLLLLRTHGITKNPAKFINKDLAYSPSENFLTEPSSHSSNVNPWYYEMQELGFNYRITDIQCALGLTQLKKLDIFVEKRRSIAAKYDEAFKDIEWIKTPVEPEASHSTYHLYVVQIDFNKLGKNRSQVMTILKEKGVGTQVHYIPVHLQPYYGNKFGYKEGDYPTAEQYYKRCLSLPIFPLLSDGEIDMIINSVIEELKIEDITY